MYYYANNAWSESDGENLRDEFDNLNAGEKFDKERLSERFQEEELFPESVYSILYLLLKQGQVFSSYEESMKALSER